MESVYSSLAARGGLVVHRCRREEGVEDGAAGGEGMSGVADFFSRPRDLISKRHNALMSREKNNSP